MKKMICGELGGAGTCQHEFSAEKFEDLMTQAKEHVISTPAHEPEQKQMASMSEQDHKAWEEKAKSLWEAKPEV